MKSLEFYKNKTEEVIEGAYLSKEQTEENSFGKNIKNIFSPESSKYLRLTAFLHLIENAIPASLLDKYKKSFYDVSRLPFDLNEYSFEGRIGHGSESIVYLLKAKEKGDLSYVLKMLRPIKYKDTNTNTLIELAKKRKQECEDMKKLFSAMPDLIPEENFVIMENPKRGEGGVVVSVQKFGGYDMKDLFDVPIEEIQKIYKENSDFQKEMKTFAKINMQMYQEKGEMIDLTGPNNVSLIRTEEGNTHLVFIDPHLTCSNDPKNSEEKESFKKREKRLMRLENIALMPNNAIIS